jgi:hypothetical protein
MIPCSSCPRDPDTQDGEDFKKELLAKNIHMFGCRKHVANEDGDSLVCEVTVSCDNPPVSTHILQCMELKRKEY